MKFNLQISWAKARVMQSSINPSLKAGVINAKRLKGFSPDYLLLILLSAALFLSSCSSTKPISRISNNIHSLDTKNPELKTETVNENAKNYTVSKKESAVLIKKYSEKLNTDESILKNLPLLKFIDDWYGVPYKYAGIDKKGIDCSGFACVLLNNVYDKKIDNTSSGLHDLSKPVKKDDLEEGDLVFFKINKGKISHVGVYLYNNYFVHASTKLGVVISNLNEDYYKKYYCCAGRIEIK